MNHFLARAAMGARRHFSGPLTYASGLWEDIDWDIFDIVGVDAYRDAGNVGGFRDMVRGYRKYGRPVVVTEVGCCTYAGAEDRGGMGWMVVDSQTTPRRLSKPLVRDEGVQARYLTEMLTLFMEADDKCLIGRPVSSSWLDYRPPLSLTGDNSTDIPAL